jgi:uncharacterized protein YidB (DUF937 family)
MGLMDVLKGMQYGPRGQPGPRSGTGSGTGTGTGSGTGTGVSPITLAILGLLAYKALKSMSRHEEQPAPAGGGGAGGNILARNPARDMSSRDLQQDMETMDMEPRDADMGRGMPSGGAYRQAGAPDRSGGGMATTEPGGAEAQAQGRVGDLIKGALGGLLAGSAAGGVMSGGLSDLLKQLQKAGFADTADSWVGSGPNRTIAPGDLAKALGADQVQAMMEHSGLSREEVLDGLSKHLPEVIDQLTPEGKVPRNIPM